MPPSPEEIERFLSDKRPDAYERLVDELLASPRYGEHAARRWLDVVRYSDSNGFDWDEFRPQAWRFRDYVIRSLNADKPYDQFVREQLAGDELISGPPKTQAEQDSLIATTYLRLGPHDNAAGIPGLRAGADGFVEPGGQGSKHSTRLSLSLSRNSLIDHRTGHLPDRSPTGADHGI